MAKRDGRSSRIPKTNEHENRAAVRPSGKEPQKCSPSTTTRLESCPELSVITTNLGNDVAGPKHVEYRVASFRTLRSGRVVRLATWSVADIAAIALVGWLWRQGKARAPWTSYDSLWEQIGSYGWLLFLVLWIYSTTRQILWESITPLPGLGIQLSTTRGVRSPFFSVRIPISTSRIFVPLSDISTIIINEGLTCWSVKHYLAVVKRDGRGVVVAFDSVRPSLAVLKEVYHGVREITWDEFGSADGV